MAVDLTRKVIYDPEISRFSSQRDDATSAKYISSDSSYWATGPIKNGENQFVVLDYKDEVTSNFIEITPSQNNTAFPNAFRIETSLNGKEWTVLHSESNFILDENRFQLHFPLIKLRYIRFVISRIAEGQDHAEIAKLISGISGYEQIEASIDTDATNRLENLFDGSDQTYWKIKEQKINERCTLLINLNAIFSINSVILKAAELEKNLFPKRFLIEASCDAKIWTEVAEQKNFSAEQGETYKWSFDSLSARYIRFEFDTVAAGVETFSLAIASLGISGIPVINKHCHTYGEAPSYASVFQAGLVRFAKDGEDARDAAVRSSDRRLRDATTFFKGIVQFAEDGADTPNCAVTASDSRIKPATELSPGIVQLAYDYETKKGTAVQASDPRLKDATEKSPGIVKLCPDGAYSELGVVRGSDMRLREASEDSAGIVRLAKNGETNSNSVLQSNDSRIADASEFSRGIVSFSKDGEATQGKAVQANDRRLRDATTTTKGIVELAEDGEVKEMAAVQSNDRRLKDATTEAKGIVELAENGEIKEGAVVQSNDNRLRDASIETKGIVRLAEDGEVTAEKAVQSNDKRLRNASSTFRGIVRLAEDGETNADTAVQGNDKRLRDATTTYKGIVELAENGEVAPDKVVQSDDKRLRDASTATKGILQFAENNETAAMKAVQGNDERLRDASVSHKGIVQLAENGEAEPFKAIQSNDKRLRDASTESKGIVQLANSGENSPLKAVQSDDPRLQDASTTSKGIVRLAKEGECETGTAVQSTDHRLKDASEEKAGIVRYAKAGETRDFFAVQSSDPRLSDARKALPHEHEYAKKDHEFNSHKGTISVSDEKASEFSGILPVPDETAIIYAKNSSAQNGAVGLGGIIQGNKKEDTQLSYGVLGHSDHIGVRGQSQGRESGIKGAGVLGVSRNAPGGVFISEHDYSLVVDGTGSNETVDPSLKLVGDGKALKVTGSSFFDGKISLASPNSENENTINICELFVLEDDNFISNGDVVVISESGGELLKKTHKAYDKAVAGVVAGNPAIEINNSNKEVKHYPIALTGKVMCKVDARTHPIKPGDLIVTSATPGCGMKGEIDSFDKIGTVLGKALEGLSEGTGVIPVFLCHQ